MDGFMSGKFSYQDYVHDKAFLEDYNTYQRKYAEEPRESDKVIIEIVRQHLAQRRESASVSLLDIGCSTGNLLLHLKKAFPEISLTGGDLAESSLDLCRRDPALTDIVFERMDIMALPQARFDIVVVNAVLYMFDQAQYELALASIASSLRAGGCAIIYDFAHEFGQDIEILEKTDSHPDGLRLCFRPMTKIQASMAKAGFSAVAFQPFELPIDLPRPADDNAIITYTRTDDQQQRMAFRGTLYQPWCHIVARKR